MKNILDGCKSRLYTAEKQTNELKKKNITIETIQNVAQRKKNWKKRESTSVNCGQHQAANSYYQSTQKEKGIVRQKNLKKQTKNFWNLMKL